MIGNILAKFEKNLSSGFFQGNDLNMKHTIIMLDQFSGSGSFGTPKQRNRRYLHGIFLENFH